MKNILEVGQYVQIYGEAVADSELSSNKGTIVKLWNEPLANGEPTPLVKMKLDTGDYGTVGQHEVEPLPIF